MIFNVSEYVIKITPLNPFDRFDDGRPRVPDDLLERMKLIEMEAAWKVLQDHGYYNQFEGNLVNLHPDRSLIGRALTMKAVPARPDLDDVVMAEGKREGRQWQSPHVWALNAVGKNDVLVFDTFGKVQWGCYFGDCNATAAASQGGAGLVIDGGIRDPQGIYDIPNFNVFCRGFNPTYAKDATVISVNEPTRIGQATVLPGDIVMGNRGGVLFIPPHLVEEVIEKSEPIHIHETFLKQMVWEHRYRLNEVYIPREQWTDEVKADFEKWCKQHQSK